MSPAPPLDVGRTLDSRPWTGYQQLLVLLTALTIIFDGFDNQLLGLALPSIMADWSLAPGAMAPVVSVGYVGMMIGGAIAGLAGDRYGRRTALLGCVLLFAAATLLIALTTELYSLGTLRFLAGIGLGGAIPNAAALAAEYVPLRQRPFAVTLAIVCVPLGGTLAGLFAVPAIPAVGWRGLFLIGGAIPAAVALILFRVLPESPHFLARRPARHGELARLLRRMGHEVPSDATFSRDAAGEAGGPVVERTGTVLSPAFRHDTLALWGAFLSCLLAVYLAFSWLPSLLARANLGPGLASTGLTVFNLGGVAGALAGGAVIARFGSKRPMLTMAAGAVIAAVVLSSIDLPRSSVAIVLGLLTVTGALINGVQTTMYALAAQVYPTALRSTGVGTASAVGRTGAILSGYAGSIALEIGGSATYFGLMAASLAVTFVSLSLIRRHIPAR
jgi:AAHS family 4-hydroxybenzoate transporter-like MFS transporter